MEKLRQTFKYYKLVCLFIHLDWVPPAALTRINYKCQYQRDKGHNYDNSDITASTNSNTMHPTQFTLDIHTANSNASNQYQFGCTTLRRVQMNHTTTVLANLRQTVITFALKRIQRTW